MSKTLHCNAKGFNQNSLIANFTYIMTNQSQTKNKVQSWTALFRAFSSHRQPSATDEKIVHLQHDLPIFVKIK